MLEDFNVQAEDGSPAQVGQGLLQWYQQCLAGDFSMLERLRQVQDGAEASRGQAVRARTCVARCLQSGPSRCLQTLCSTTGADAPRTSGGHARRRGARCVHTGWRD